MRFKVVLTFLFLACNFDGFSQNNVNRIESIKLRLESVATEIPQLHNKVSITVSGVSLYEFLRGVAIDNKLNMNVDPALDTTITINFTNVTIDDLLVYLCDQYNCEILVTGNNILSIVKYITPVIEISPMAAKSIKVSFNSATKAISYDLQNDTLGPVLKKLTQVSNINILTTQKLQNTLVSGYVENMSLINSVIELAHINNLSFSVNKDSNTYYLEEPIPKTANIPLASNSSTTLPIGLKVLTNNKDSILSVYAVNSAIKDLLSAVANQLNINYYVTSELKGNIDLKLEHIDFPTFLRYLFNGTDYTYRYNNGIYLFGDRKTESIRTSDVYPLKYRTTNKVMEMIPSELKKGIELISLPDLNSLIISGSSPVVNEVEAFLRQIDKTVPVINIELIILDITNTHQITTGISAGINNSQTSSNASPSTYTSLFPNINVTLGSNTINSIINSINGTGLVNLGSVTPNFYISLQASETNGSIKIRSTPRLATLNGSEAQMTIGETRYYQETTSNIIATQSTTTVSSVIFKPLQANLAINIKPIVSGDEQITLDITVEQGTFTNQVATNGPYGQTNRTFKSSIRVKNNDMILLGGLEEKNNNNSGQGLPILSRIPILKWLFSSRSVNNSKSKLAILIHPTVIY